jgi:hypothetical protein
METYLGDGLYVSFDGFAFTLRAPRLEGDHYVVLEPAVFREFASFVKQTEEERLESGRPDSKAGRE